MLSVVSRFSVSFVRSIHCPSAAVYAVTPRAAQSTGKKRFRRPVQDDAHKLVNYLCGSNILKEGEDVKLKDDSEYPDWIWELKLDGPKQLNDYDKNSKEYWETLAFLGRIRQLRLTKNKMPERKIVSRRWVAKQEWEERLKHRVIATQEYDAGYDPKELEDPVDRKLYLKPQPIDEPLYIDELKLPPKFK